MGEKTAPGPAGNPGVPTPDDDLTGKTLGDFRLLRRLGQGGMGQVYLGEQVSLQRKVAVKILRAELAADQTALRRFEVEAHAVARMTHANIVQVYAFGSCEGIHYMAMEFVDGRNLREYLARKGPPDVLLALSIMRQVAAALQRAGEHGIVHRDIKPDNILLTRKGEVKVADFGLSRRQDGDQASLNLTQSGVTMGTPLYMSPEQVQGKKVDARTDMYSFGVTCYHMLAGHPPFNGQSAFEVALQHVQNEPVPLAKVRPDLPADLCAIVARMMAKDPEQRYQTGRDLLRDLSRVRESLPGVTGASRSPLVSGGSLDVALPGDAPGSLAATGTVPPRSRARFWLPWVAAATVALALLMGAAVGMVRNDPLGWFHPLAAAETPAPQSPAAVGEASPEIRKLEQALVEAAKKYPNPDPPRPGTRPMQLIMGLDARIELGLFYLDQQRLDDAERFFQGLLANSADVPAYQTLGEIGRGIVLARRDRPKESYAAFRKARTHPQYLTIMLRNFPRLAERMAEALHRDVDNHEPAPPELKTYLEFPPGPRWFGMPRTKS